MEKKLSSEEIENLVALSQKGESEAFAKLYDTFVTPIFKYIYYRVGSSDAEDLTELVFLKTWENIGQYKRGYKNFSSWIFRIAHNIVVDHYRSNKFVEELNENIQEHRDELDSKRLANNTLNNEILSKAMGELKDEYRQILILSYINDLSGEEVGNIMERSQAALRILKFRALRSLRRVLEKMGVDGDLSA